MTAAASTDTATLAPTVTLVDWPSGTATSIGGATVTITSQSAVPSLTKTFRTTETQYEEAKGGDFWARLTEIEMESRMSRGGAALRLGIDQLPVASQIDDRDGAAGALLTTAVRRLAVILHAIIASKAARAGLQIRKAYFDVDRDDEDGSRQLVMIVRVDANAAQALAFWTSLDYEMDRWLLQLPESEQQIVTSRLGLRFVWDGSSGR